MKFEKFKPENYKNVDIKFTLRLPEELHQEIANYSSKHNVSMNTLILNCIEYAMSNREDKQAVAGQIVQNNIYLHQFPLGTNPLQKGGAA